MNMFDEEMIFKKLNKDSIKPRKGSKLAAGYDLFSIENYTLKPFERYLFKTGITLEIPDGIYGRIAPRSGLAYKNGIDVLAGVVDSDYRGDIGVILINLSNEDVKIEKGKAIAQIIFENYKDFNLIEDEILSDTERGESGYGSSDS